jgi:hydrogenase expression/formation protein HypC
MCLGTIVRLEEVWESGDMPMGRGTQSDGRAICLAYVPDAATGDHVLVHLGFALEVLAPHAAAEALAAREELSGAGPPPADRA